MTLGSYPRMRVRGSFAMIEYDLDSKHNILLVRPESALDNNDFVELAKAVDPPSRPMATLPASLSARRHSRAGRISERWLPTSASSGIIKSTSKRSRWSPSRTSRMWPSIWDHTLCQPRSNIFPSVTSSKRDNGLLTARNLLSRNVSRGAY